jgi:hypothetical protein
MRRLAWLVFIGFAALVATNGGRANEAFAQCGNGIVDVGEECDPPATELCANRIDDDLDGLIDCVDPDCRPDDAMFVCGLDCVAAPACQPAAGDARIYFAEEPKLDRLWVKVTGLPLTDMVVPEEPVAFMLSNVGIPFCTEAMSGADFKSRRYGKLFKYKHRKDGRPACYEFRVMHGADRATGLPACTFKFKVADDLGYVDPDVSGQAEDVLANIFIQVAVGEDAFYLDGVWERTGRGWRLRAR